MVKSDYLDLILKILTYLFLVIIIYQLILKLLGFSPTDTIILYSFVSLLIINGLKTQYDLGRLKEFSETAKNSFKKIKNEMEELKLR